MKTSQEGREFIQAFEKCKLVAYPDPGTGGAPWTIGWGTTGKHVLPGLRCTQAEADKWFDEHISRFEAEVVSLLKVPVSQGQFDALVSFAYNCGSDIDADNKAEGLGDSTLLRKLNAGDYIGAAAEFPKWNRSGGRILNGLTRRRDAEQLMFLNDTSPKSGVCT